MKYFSAKFSLLFFACFSILFLANSLPGIFSVSLSAAGIKSKVIKGKLNSKGAVLLSPGKIAISGLNFKEPNFIISAYIYLKTEKYWVSSRVFIDDKGISIEASPSFRAYPFRIVIHYE